MDHNKLCMGCMEEKDSIDLCPHCGWFEVTQAESPLPLEPRTILNGKYLLGRVLGQGGFGITYLGWDIYLDRKLAVKEYFPREFAYREKGIGTVTLFSNATQSQYEYGLNKFLEEGKTLARLEGHPNIVSIRDFFKANDTAYIVMSYVEGISFSDYLKKHGSRLSYSEAVQVMMPVLDALRAIHEVNLLHRDISPDNIYITINGRVIILDFGAARQAFGEKGEKLSVILKPGYAPEEQYRSRGKQGYWTDIYAVGATIYLAITGQMPPDSLDRLENDPIVCPSELGVAINPAEETVLMKAMAVKAENRYQTVESFQADLLQTPAEIVQTWEVDEDNLQLPKIFDKGYEERSTGADALYSDQNNPDLLKHRYRDQPADLTTNSADIVNIGRSPDNQIVLPEGTVSRRHARIFMHQGRLYLTDLQSSYGTFLDNQKVEQPVELLPSSTIVISENRLHYDGYNLLNENGDILWPLKVVGSHRKSGGVFAETDLFYKYKTPIMIGLSIIITVILFLTLPDILMSLKKSGDDSDSAVTLQGSDLISTGTIEYLSGTYTGELKNGIPHGFGTITIKSESKSLDFSQIITPKGEEKYSGEWLEGKMHGEGILTLSDGTTITGVWNDDQYLGPKND